MNLGISELAHGRGGTLARGPEARLGSDNSDIPRMGASSLGDRLPKFPKLNDWGGGEGLGLARGYLGATRGLLARGRWT